MTLARIQSRNVKQNAAGERFEPFSEVQTIFTIPFFFQSLSGDILSPQNIKTQEQLLNSTREIVNDLCYQGKYAPKCSPPRTIMRELGTYDSAEIKLQLSERGKEHDSVAPFLGENDSGLRGLYTYNHTFKDTNMHAYMCTYMQTYVHACTHTQKRIYTAT